MSSYVPLVTVLSTCLPSPLGFDMYLRTRRKTSSVVQKLQICHGMHFYILRSPPQITRPYESRQIASYGLVLYGQFIKNHVHHGWPKH